MTHEEIARVAYETNRAYCLSHGDDSFGPWDEAPDWQKSSLLAGIQFHIDNPDAKPEDSHNSWLAEKKKDGWKYGEVKDPEKKEHPCFVPYGDLPIEQQRKDSLFIGVVRALLTLIAAIALPSIAMAQDAGDPWWLMLLKIAAPALTALLTLGLTMLARKVFRLIDAKTSLHTEARGMRVAEEIILHIEQTSRRLIAEDLADGKIDAEEAKARVFSLGAEAVGTVMSELGVSEKLAGRMVENAMIATGASRGARKENPTPPPSEQ